VRCIKILFTDLCQRWAC